MKKLLYVVTGLIMGLGFTMSAFCADATLNLDVNSAYISRGYTYNDGLVLQPSLDVLKGGFDINIWGNMDIDDYDNSLDSGEFSEVDLAMYYSHSIDKLTLTGGIIAYIYPLTNKTGGETTEELYVNGTLALIENLTLGLSVYYDYDEYDETCYSNLALAYTIPVNKQLGVTAGIAAGYVDRDEDKWGESGFNEYKLSLKATYTLSDTLGMGANINYVDAIDDDVLKTDVNTFGGVSVYCKF